MPLDMSGTMSEGVQPFPTTGRFILRTNLLGHSDPATPYFVERNLGDRNLVAQKIGARKLVAQDLGAGKLGARKLVARNFVARNLGV